MVAAVKSHKKSRGGGDGESGDCEGDEGGDGEMIESSVSNFSFIEKIRFDLPCFFIYAWSKSSYAYFPTNTRKK